MRTQPETHRVGKEQPGAMDGNYINRLSFTAGGTTPRFADLGKMILRFNFHALRAGRLA
jgi:hypothetical protein